MLRHHSNPTGMLQHQMQSLHHGFMTRSNSSLGESRSVLGWCQSPSPGTRLQFLQVTAKQLINNKKAPLKSHSFVFALKKKNQAED